MSDAWHYTPDLFDRLVDTVPVLVKSKQQMIDFFRSAGTPEALLNDLQDTLNNDPRSINKYYIARTVIRKLNEGGDRLIAARRELIRRVTQWEDFSLSWPADQDKARGLVAAVRQLVNVRDSFTRMQQERDRERHARVRQQEEQLEKRRARRSARAAIRTQLVAAKNDPNAQRRGKYVEKVVADLCAVEGIQICEPFEIRNNGTPEEQLDGVIMATGQLYLVEVKWWGDAVDLPAMSSHLIRLFRRPDTRGLFFSSSGYTEAAIAACRDVLRERLMVLAELNELIFLLEGDRALEDWVGAKAALVVAERNPFRVITNF